MEKTKEHALQTNFSMVDTPQNKQPITMYQKHNFFFIQNNLLEA